MNFYARNMIHNKDKNRLN